MQTTRPRPVPPVMPAHLRRQMDLLDVPVTPENMTPEHLSAILGSLTLTPEQAAAERAYDAEVARYNAEVDAYNAPILAARQRRINEAEAERTRAAACPRCFTIHAGDECY